MIQEIVRYVTHFIKQTKSNNPEINEKILKSCLAYQYLYHKHFNTYLSVEEILVLNNGEIGLIGPSNGCLTGFLEKTLGLIDTLHSHSILHDAFGRFYTKYKLDRGYMYVIPENLSTKRMKVSPLSCQLLGIFYCAFNRIYI